MACWTWINGSKYLMVTVNAPTGDWCNRWLWTHYDGFRLGDSLRGTSNERYAEIFGSEQFLIMQEV